MMQHAKHIFLMTWLLLLLGVLSAFSQQLTFHVVSFAEDPFDLTARNDQYKKIDGSGSLYAVIKVGSTNPEGLREYNFNFGNMNHLVEWHDGKLWVYVQKNAKMVTIMRPGYTTIDRYDLHTTIESGKTYVMQLSEQAPVIMTQMVMFQTEPKVTGAVVMVQREGEDSPKELFGTTDVTGVAAKGLEFGTYTYEVMAENYYSSEGRFTLNNQNETHRENVMLRSNGANITLAVATNADIYINGTKKGTRSWTGSLKTGLHNVECRQENHRPSSQTISVKEGEDQSIVLAPPTPITGVLAITSTPSGAAIYVDGKSYGTTPRNITDLLIGQHTIKLNLNGYGEAQTTVDIKEHQTTDINLVLKEQDRTVAISNESESTVSDDDLSQINIIYTDGVLTVDGIQYNMVRVEGGTFQMGGSSMGYRAAKPIHNVTLNEYYIGKTEITQALWQAVMRNNPSEFRGADLPVENISWDDCQAFISRLNQLTGRKFRLPTEAEWEFAARGGIKSNGYKFSGSNNYDDVAWYYENSGDSRLKDFSYSQDNLTSNHCHPHPVSTKKPNELGLYDMSGNVYEWCQDWYDENYYKNSPNNNPSGPTNGITRVFRGNSWNLPGLFYIAQLYYRGYGRPTDHSNMIGFRLALSE